MNLFRTILLLSICTFYTISLVAQQQFVKGLILSQSDSSIISHAHIINTTSKIGVTSNQTGAFFIQAKLEDTLVISFIGFKSLRISASNIDSKVYLTRAIHNIETYTVLPYKDFNEFREAFTKLELKDTSSFKLNTSFVLSIDELKSWGPPQSILRGQFTALAVKFNKRIKDKKNYDRLIARDKHRAFLATKFNSKLVKQATVLREEYQINSFMEYCDFTDQFIELSSHYKLVDQIINCFDEYTNLPMVNK